MTIDRKDLKIDSYRGDSVAVRITHLPTGTQVTASGDSYLQARMEAEEALYEEMNEEL